MDLQKIEDREIKALKGIYVNQKWDHILETVDSVCDDEDVLMENTELAGDEVENDIIVSEWYMKEAQLLGDLFTVQEGEGKRCRAMLEKVNLNYGENGKCVKRKKMNNGVEEFDFERDLVDDNGC